MVEREGEMEGWEKWFFFIGRCEGWVNRFFSSVFYKMILFFYCVGKEGG